MARDLDTFIDRWKHADGSERANYQLFLTELTEALDLPRPDPAASDTAENAYVFERRVSFRYADGSESHGFIDLYRRGAFVCEAKQTGIAIDSKTWDNAMLRAHGQAQQYARALPASEGRPPFLIVTDVGRSLELYAEFTRSGATYVPYPDPRSHRIRLEDLARAEVQETLRTVWTDPLSLDPARRSARVTRAIADRLARLAKSLETAGHPADSVAAFLMRCLFTMFAEDVGLLPERAFTDLLEETRKAPELLPRLLPGLWQAMNHGGFSAEIRADVLKFNGGLFAVPDALPLDRAQIDLLIEAARADWRHVEPAIFGTLLERALDPVERHKLGAHYTPRAYVERLVMPTIIEPLRAEWNDAQGAALLLDAQGKRDQAVAEIRAFHHRLCHVRVLDPACGSGNFLYVTLEHLKRLEGEVLNTLDELGDTQGRLELAGVTVDPHQMLGLETNPRAARIAEAVLWIGYLQWHFRTRGNVNPPEPVLKDFHNIECRDAVLAWDGIEYVADDQGIPVTRWDGRSYKTHPVTGEPVPDETARVPLERYLNPRKAGWPDADFVVGNPPFIGTKRMKQALGDGYVEAVRNTYPKVPESADFVMYWWHHAADLTRVGKLQRFGLITTNSLPQSFNRKVVQYHLEHKQPLSLAFAIPDHPWVDSADGAAVRIAMTVGTSLPSPASGRGAGGEGLLLTVVGESGGDGEGRDVRLASRAGKIHADLKIGANVAAAVPLIANQGVSGMGVALHGSGFILEPEEADRIRADGADVIKGYLGGRDLLQTRRERYLIDFSGMTVDEARHANPTAFQHVIEYVKPERDHNNRKPIRELWWRFGWERPVLRKAVAALTQYIGTTETSRHRLFQFLDGSVLADHKILCVALETYLPLGVLSSRIHVIWSLAVGGRLGVGNDSIYNKVQCFDAFPFPALAGALSPGPSPASGRGEQGGAGASDAALAARIRDLAEQLDAHRKRQQALHPDLTLTGMYNVLEKLRLGEPLSARDRTVHEHGLVSVLAELHDRLDEAVLAAYGWSDLAPKLVGKPGGTTPCPDKPAEQAEAEEELLQRLVDLNAARAAEEARGRVRWLRPEFQNPGGARAEQTEAGIEPAEAVAATAKGKTPWPKSLAEQIRRVRETLAAQPGPVSAEQLARQFQRAQTKRVAEVLDALAGLGQVRQAEDGRFLVQ